MIREILLCSCLLFSTVSFSQWEFYGNTITEQNINNSIGYSLATNDTGDKIAYLRFAEGFEKKVSVVGYENGGWTNIGDIVPFYVGNNSSASIAMNSDGSRFVVGIGPTNDLGILKVFEFQNNSWVQLGQDITGDTIGDGFGASVAMDGSGNNIIAGAGKITSGYIKVFELSNDVWLQKGETIEEDVSGEQFGSSVAINQTGNTIVASAPSSDESFIDAGKIKVYQYQANDWQQKGGAIVGAKANDKIGLANKPGNSAVKLNFDGTVVAYGTWAHLNDNSQQVGLVEVLEYVNNDWETKGSRFEGSTANSFLGGSIDLDRLGGIVTMTDFQASGGSQVLTYKFEDFEWQQINETIIDPDFSDTNFFGFSVAINAEGNILAIGDPNDGNGDESNIWVYQNQSSLSAPDIVSYQFKLYPNPNRSKFNIEFSDNQARITVKILDVLGKDILTRDFYNAKTVEIEENLDPGVYLAKVSTEKISETIRIVVKR
ncbi:T9SS type A sorting domain-containing protein [Marinirhabdus gelatinilytica]|uniref:Putative secreted protein (Por secretion system target) n=1 Tax=Marinirhabdus gelatinilytica TaxID=1703343 RepID=A0A370QJD8_9FLAO|nr:T9SS type A sorting domain-containing protein [Marinirhabdus gelatinilytica]RDK88487.1 putative secreted protein (Por secretion system target) [Marinirhabdus gelatinilytica]